jgi:signal transduction histidine kinase
LEDRLAEWSRRTGITVEVWALPKERLAGRIAAVVHGVIREVLQEIERQAQARTICFALTVARTGLRLTISDDDGGMTAKALEALETRLLTGRADLTRLGGRLSVNSVLGEGTTVSGALPPKAIKQYASEENVPVPASLADL